MTDCAAFGFSEVAPVPYSQSGIASVSDWFTSGSWCFVLRKRSDGVVVHVALSPLAVHPAAYTQDAVADVVFTAAVARTHGSRVPQEATASTSSRSHHLGHDKSCRSTSSSSFHSNERNLPGYRCPCHPDKGSIDLPVAAVLPRSSQLQQTMKKTTKQQHLIPSRAVSSLDSVWERVPPQLCESVGVVIVPYCVSKKETAEVSFNSWLNSCSPMLQ